MSNIIQKEIDKREKERKLRFISLKKLEGTEAEAAKKRERSFLNKKRVNLKLSTKDVELALVQEELGLKKNSKKN